MELSAMRTARRYTPAFRTAVEIDNGAAKMLLDLAPCLLGALLADNYRSPNSQFAEIVASVS
jgi:hypothetical protein